ncbi:hypothetical protein SAY87_025471 [Trapa incisa]|uniref:Association with the SNF1 complex (ASC) domain-containing protein n=1 Tax=Trapa incisa TaxID=236973 RepID=A0AAN7GDN9_9MYRT|nr:hypothetical protein SAY87_025471 [Trapa incisa]
MSWKSNTSDDKFGFGEVKDKDTSANEKSNRNQQVSPPHSSSYLEEKRIPKLNTHENGRGHSFHGCKPVSMCSIIKIHMHESAGIKPFIKAQAVVFFSLAQASPSVTLPVNKDQNGTWGKASTPKISMTFVLQVRQTRVYPFLMTGSSQHERSGSKRSLNEDETREPPLVPQQLQHPVIGYPPSRDAWENIRYPVNVILHHLYIENRMPHDPLSV